MTPPPMSRWPLLLLLWIIVLPESRAEPNPPPATGWTTRYERARDLIREGKVEESLALGKETETLAAQSADPSDPRLLLTAQNELAQLYLRCHRFPEAEKWLKQITATAERVYGPNDSRTVAALYDLGWFYSNMTQFAQAEALFQRVLESDEKTVGRRHRHTALVLNSLGVLYENKGDYAKAENYFTEAISIQTEILGADTLTTATTVNNLATLYWSCGDYRRAEKYFAEALAVRERLKGRGSLATATTVNNLALVYLGMGNYERAETLFWRVLRIREQKLGVNHPLTLTTANHLGLLYEDMGDYKAAESFLQRAAQSREKVIGVDQPDTARAIFHLAHLYDTTGQYAKAEPFHRRALGIRERILGAAHPETAASYGFLARHYHLAGQPARAEPLYEKALALQKTALGPNHPDVLKTLDNLACLKWQTGDRKTAAALATEAAGIREHQLQNLFLFTSEKQRIDFQKTVNFYNLTCTLGDAEEIARVVYRTKGVVLDSLLEDKRALLAATDEETKKWIAELHAVSRELENGTSHSGDIIRENREREADRLRTRIAERLGFERTARRALQVTPAEIANAIPGRAAVIEWIRYNACRPHLKSEPSYGALVQRHGQRPLWVDLGPAAPIDTQVRQYQKQVRRRVRETALAGTLQRLHQLVWQPLESVLGTDCEKVILSPDAELNFVSFATLLGPDNRFLTERYTLEYVTSARDLLRPRTDLPKEKTWLAFAAPEFGPQTATNSFRLTALSGTSKEADSIEADARKWGFSTVSFRGANADEHSLRQARMPTILHIATHGVFRETSEAKNSSPRSFLALAGAQKTLDAWQRGEIPSAETDGILTAEEIAALDLRGTWLVVLSACDTGMGEARAGEGVLGLRRGFLLAGAQNLVMSLWPVGDAETVAFMEDFYRQAIPTGDAARALSDVQQKQLIRLRQEKGLWHAVRSAGPFILSD